MGDSVPTRAAHIFDERKRTADVHTNEDVDFKSLLLSEPVLTGLDSAGFERPSPVQLQAIPLGRCGLDLIVQAKSGTGKTCVFSVIALESLDLESTANTKSGKVKGRSTSALTQVLVLAPTREIAVQIHQVIMAIGSAMAGLQCHVFIGGMPVQSDKAKLANCHIAIGTPGRIKYLIEEHLLLTQCIRLFALDEADKLLEENFQEQVNWIFSSLPANKQMLALSATYPEYLAKHLTKYMRDPTFVRLNSKDQALRGLKQYYKTVPHNSNAYQVFKDKVHHLLQLLSRVSFHQCLIFSNLQTRAQNLSDILNSKGWPTTFIAGSQDQSVRLKAMDMLKKFQCRILISTDLTARGIDAERVNLVVNLDVPWDAKTYLHRIGRAGRFGTIGVGVTYASQGSEVELLDKIKKQCRLQIHLLPDHLSENFIKQELQLDLPDDELGQANLLPTPNTTQETSPVKPVNSEENNGRGHHNTAVLNFDPDQAGSQRSRPKPTMCSVGSQTESPFGSDFSEPLQIAYVPPLSVKELQNAPTFSEILDDYKAYVKEKRQEKVVDTPATNIADGDRRAIQPSDSSSNNAEAVSTGQTTEERAHANGPQSTERNVEISLKKKYQTSDRKNKGSSKQLTNEEVKQQTNKGSKMQVPNEGSNVQLTNEEGKQLTSEFEGGKQVPNEGGKQLTNEGGKQVLNISQPSTDGDVQFEDKVCSPLLNGSNAAAAYSAKQNPCPYCAHMDYAEYQKWHFAYLQYCYQHWAYTHSALFHSHCCSD